MPMFFSKVRVKYEYFHHVTFHNALVFMHSEKSDCIVDNIYLEIQTEC